MAEDKIQSSPVIKIKDKDKVREMPFPEAMGMVIQDYRITRVDWENTEEYGLLKDGTLQIHTKGKYHSWLVSDGDMLATDWLVIPDAN